MMCKSIIEQIDFFGNKYIVIEIKNDSCPKRIDKVLSVHLGQEGMSIRGYYSPQNGNDGSPEYIEMILYIAYDSIASIIAYGRDVIRNV